MYLVEYLCLLSGSICDCTHNVVAYFKDEAYIVLVFIEHLIFFFCKLHELYEFKLVKYIYFYPK